MLSVLIHVASFRKKKKKVTASLLLKMMMMKKKTKMKRRKQRTIILNKTIIRERKLKRDLMKPLMKTIHLMRRYLKVYYFEGATSLFVSFEKIG